jgi:hypothetical protein
MVARRHRCMSLERERERRQIDERELMRRIPTPTSAVATMQICGFRAVMVLRTGARRHVHRCVHRSRAVHGARRDSEEKPTVEHEPEPDQRTHHASSDRAAHHARKVGLGTKHVQSS